MTQNIHDLSGEMHFAWEIGKNTLEIWATEDKLKLPAGVTIPLGDFLDGLPLTLDISAALLTHPGLTGNNEACKGSFVIKFPGSQNDMTLTFDVTGDASLSPIAPNAMVTAFCAPRVELPPDLLNAIRNSPLNGMTITHALASSADVFAQVIHSEGASHTVENSLLPCTKIDLEVSGQVGGERKPSMSRPPPQRRTSSPTRSRCESRAAISASLSASLFK